MHVDVMLCDAATVREGLLHILGAGITRLNRPSYPALMGVNLAIMMTMQRSEAQEQHQLKVILQDEDGKQVGQIEGQMGLATPAPGRPGEPVALPIVLNLAHLAIPRPGTYSFEILIDRNVVRTLPFTALMIPAPKPSTPE
jgi:hypothetical protein